MESKHRKLEVPEDLAFQKREWKAERISWICLGLILLAGFLGVFGRGGVSWTTKRSELGGLYMEYERFLRNNTPSKIIFHIPSPQSDHITLWISNQTIKSINVESSSPEPAITEAFDDGTRFTYRLGNRAPAEITVRIMPETYWSSTNTIVLNGKDTLSMSQFTYP